MHRRLHTTAAAALLTAGLLAGCSSSDTTTDTKPSKTASPTPDKISSIGACVALLESNYQNDTMRDVSNDPECASLTEDEYTTAVAGILAGHKDDILADAEQQYVWDEAWSQTDPAQQDLMCDRLHADGPEVVGQEMIDAADGAPSGDEVAMAEYILEEKC